MGYSNYEKSKTKGKPKRRRLIIAILMVLFAVCLQVSFNIYRTITQKAYFDNALLNDIENTYSESLVEDRLLENLTIGHSTRTEVEAFGDEHLDNPAYPCLVNNEASQTCYNINRRPTFGCEYYLLKITFVFADDVLEAIEFANNPKCL